MSEIICYSSPKGLGVKCASPISLEDAASLWLLPRGYSFADTETFATLANIKTAQAAHKLFVIPEVKNSENQKVENRIHQTAYGDKIFKGFGLRGKKYFLNLTMDQHKILFEEYAGKKWDVIIVDRNNNIHAILEDDGTVRGKRLSYFQPMQHEDPTDANPAWSTLEIQEADPQEWDKKGYVFKPTWLVSDVDPIYWVTLSSVSTVATNVFTCVVAQVPTQTIDSDGTSISNPVSGLGVDDFYVIDQTGAENTLVSVVEDADNPGTYTITGTTLTSGSVKVQPNTTNEELYESATSTLTAA